MIGYVLHVPFKDKDEVKSLGAKWDPEIRTWYVPTGTDELAFVKWLTESEAIKTHGYYLARAINTCYKCKQRHYVYCYAVDERSGEGPACMFVQNVTAIAAEPLARIQCMTSCYKKVTTRSSQYAYFANGCPHCYCVAGDFYLHVEPGGAFRPTTAQEAALITLQYVDEPFACAGMLAYQHPDIVLAMQQGSVAE